MTPDGYPCRSSCSNLVSTLCAWPRKPSAMRHPHDTAATRARPRPRHPHQALPPHEVAHRERRRVARGAAGGQHVVGADAVVAHRHRRVGRPRRRRPPRCAAPAPAARRVITSACSGASAFTAAIPSSRSRTEHDAPRDAPAPAARRPRWRRTAAPSATRRRTSSARAADGVTSTTVSSPLPCSACASRSAATKPGSALSSASTTTSLGPASWSISTARAPGAWRRRRRRCRGRRSWRPPARWRVP